MTLEMKIREEREDAAIIQTIMTSKKYHASDREIIADLMLDFDLTENEAKKRIEEYMTDEEV